MARQTPAARIAFDIWSRLEQARQLTVRLGEETLTDLLILDLKRHGARYKIWVLQTTRPQEAKSGTDLEVVVRAAGWRSARRYAVQAKKLYPGVGYKSLTGRPARRQLDLLEKYARHNRAIPYYMFYNSGVDPRPYWHCCEQFSRSQFGCTLVPSRVVREALLIKCRDFGFMHNPSGSLPWRCLFDCSEWEGRLHTNWAETAEQLSFAGLTPHYGWLNLEPIEGVWPEELSDNEDSELRKSARLSSRSRNHLSRIADRYLENREPEFQPLHLLFIDKR